MKREIVEIDGVLVVVLVDNDKVAKGGQGSGNFGHSGRPGQVGGSSGGGGGGATTIYGGQAGDYASTHGGRSEFASTSTAKLEAEMESLEDSLDDLEGAKYDEAEQRINDIDEELNRRETSGSSNDISDEDMAGDWNEIDLGSGDRTVEAKFQSEVQSGNVSEVTLDDNIGGGTAKFVELSPSGQFSIVEINGQQQSISNADIVSYR